MAKTEIKPELMHFYTSVDLLVEMQRNLDLPIADRKSVLQLNGKTYRDFVVIRGKAFPIDTSHSTKKEGEKAHKNDPNALYLGACSPEAVIHGEEKTTEIKPSRFRIFRSPVSSTPAANLTQKIPQLSFKSVA
jgi:hypothetical protein